MYPTSRTPVTSLWSEILKLETITSNISRQTDNLRKDCLLGVDHKLTLWFGVESQALCCGPQRPGVPRFSLKLKTLAFLNGFSASPLVPTHTQVNLRLSTKLWLALIQWCVYRYKVYPSFRVMSPHALSLFVFSAHRGEAKDRRTIVSNFSSTELISSFVLLSFCSCKHLY